MAQFPKSNRKVSASGISAPFRQQQVSTDVARSIQSLGTELQRTGMTINDIDQKIKDIERTRKASDARLQAQKIINKGVLDFNTDMKPENREKHYNSITEGIRGVINDQDDPLVKDQIGNELTEQADNVKLSLQIKAIDRDKYAAERNIEVSEQEWINSVDSGDRSVVQSARSMYLNSFIPYAKNSGMSSDDIKQNIRGVEKEVAKRHISNTSADDPEAAISLLESYEDIFNDTETAKLEGKIKTIASVREAEIDKAEKEMYDNNEKQVLTEYLKGSDAVNEDTLLKLLDNKDIRPEFVKTMVNNVNSVKKVNAITSALTYIEMQNKLNEVLDKGNKIDLDDIAKFRYDAIDANTTGGLKKSMLENILFETNDIFNSKISDELSKLFKDADPRSFFQKIQEWSFKYNDDDPESTMRIHRELMGRLKSNEDPEIAINESINNEFNRLILSDKHYPAEKIAVNPNTKERIYSYDNGTTWSSERKSD